MNYSFNCNLAIIIGVDCAVMLEKLNFYIKENKVNKKNFYDGNYWTCKSIKKFAELFPFWSEKQIRRILNSLEKYGYIKVGNYNEFLCDRTKWYTLTLKCEKSVK